MAPIDVLLLSDGRPGHYTLSEGVLAAAGRIRPIRVNRIEVRRSRWLPARLLSSAIDWGWPPARLLRLAYGVDPRSLRCADLVVSAGGNTLAANVAAARLLGVPNIFYGSLRRYRPEHFALVLSSYARDARRPRHVVTPKPNKLDPDTVALPAGALPIDQDHPPKTAGLLLGGDAGTVSFAMEDWERLIAFVRTQHRAHGTEWIAASSPRTPDAAADAFAKLAREPQSPLSSFIDFRTAGPGTLGDLFKRSAAIVVTEDSSSMLSEAVWVRRPVLSVAPAGASLPDDEREYREYLAASGWTAEVPIAALTPERFVAELSRLAPLRDNPMDALAGVLARELPALFSKQA